MNRKNLDPELQEVLRAKEKLVSEAKKLNYRFKFLLMIVNHPDLAVENEYKVWKKHTTPNFAEDLGVWVRDVEKFYQQFFAKYGGQHEG